MPEVIVNRSVELRNAIAELIKNYEKIYGVEFVSAKFYNYYSVVTKENQVCGMVQVK